MIKLAKQKQLVPYCFILPSMIILFLFLIIPMIMSFVLSLSKYSIVNPTLSEIVGIKNYIDIMHDKDFYNAMFTTVIYTLATVLPGIVFGLIVVAIISEPWFKKPSLVRNILFVPYIMSMTIVGLMWSYLYSPTMGFFNYIIRSCGYPEQGFISDPNQALFCITVMVVWKGMGYNITILSAAFLALPKEMSEAAKIDGANWLQEFIRIKLPLLRPVVSMLLIVGTIGSFQAFDAIYVMTLGGPLGRTRTVVYYIYEAAFKYFDRKGLGYGAAMSWLLFVIIAILTIIQYRGAAKGVD